jgi:hypothetical protein
MVCYRTQHNQGIIINDMTDPFQLPSIDGTTNITYREADPLPPKYEEIYTDT